MKAHIGIIDTSQECQDLTQHSTTHNEGSSQTGTTDHREYNRYCITVFFLNLVTFGNV